jgi:hypothetical protein
MLIMIMIMVTCISHNDSVSKVTSDGAQFDSRQEQGIFLSNVICLYLRSSHEFGDIMFL